MNIILFDDDDNFRQHCNGILQEMNMQFTLSTDNAEEVKRYVRKHKEVALFFIDIVIHRNKEAGLALCDYILQENESNIVVFITDYPALILHNTHSKLQAKNIILKTKEYFRSEFFDTIENVKAILLGKRYFQYQTKCNGFGMVPLNDIYYFEKIKGRRTIVIHKRNGEVILHKSFTEITDQLDSRFIRCHSGMIVNIEKVRNIIPKERKILFDNELSVFYSRSHRKEIETRIPMFNSKG